MTRQQSLILSLVLSSCEHPTAEQIYRMAKEKMPSIGLATVYRNLSQLAAEGKILRISADGQPDHFDKTLIPHEHAVCRVCGEMRDVDVGDIRSRIAEKLQRDDFLYELMIFDCCPKCRAVEK